MGGVVVGSLAEDSPSFPSLRYFCRSFFAQFLFLHHPLPLQLHRKVDSIPKFRTHSAAALAPNDELQQSLASNFERYQRLEG